MRAMNEAPSQTALLTSRGLQVSDPMKNRLRNRKRRYDYDNERGKHQIPHKDENKDYNTERDENDDRQRLHSVGSGPDRNDTEGTVVVNHHATTDITDQSINRLPSQNSTEDKECPEYPKRDEPHTQERTPPETKPAAGCPPVYTISIFVVFGIMLYLYLLNS